ncbi:MAG: hypothetical protein LBB40_00830 [Holophagales bacterium]|jgi:hypothetical protein|nr:hypothetical protein [Holophagales bacterium]
MKKSLSYLIAAASALTFAFIACRSGKTDVYVVGWKKNAQGNFFVTLWKNGMAQYLSDGNSSAYAYSVYVAQNRPRFLFIF